MLSDVFPNVFADLGDMLSYDFMRNAFLAGTAMALLGGLIGYFVILRHLVFAGEALSHVAFASALGAAVLGVNTLGGIVAITVLVAVGMGLLGHRIRERDVAVGTVLAWVLGLGALFLSVYTATSSGGNSQIGVNTLFGSIFGIGTQQATAAVAMAAGTIMLLLVIARPLLFASLHPDVASARGVPVRILGVLFLVVPAVTVAEGVQVMGALLLLALLVTPAAIAQRCTAGPFAALALSAALAVGFTWIGLTASFYTSYPVGFWIPALAFIGYVGATVWPALRHRRVSRLPQT